MIALGLLALAIALGLPPLLRFERGPLLLAAAAALAFGLSFLLPPSIVVLGPVALLADGPALIALAAAALAARAQPRALLFFITLAVLAADLRLFLLALVGLVAGLAGRRRIVLTALPLLALAGILFANTGFALDLPGSTRSVVQLRAFAVVGLFLPALLLLPPAARAAGLGLWLFGFSRLALPLWPEAGLILAPILSWTAAGLSLLAAGASWLRPGLAPFALFGPALIGALTATSPGLTGAALLAAALVLLPGLAAAPLALAGAALALHAGWWAMPAFPGPVLLAAAALLVAAIPLIRKAFSQRDWVPLALTSALSITPLLGLPPPGAPEAAARTARRSLSPDDVGGWRRLTRRQSQPEPSDAGVP